MTEMNSTRAGRQLKWTPENIIATLRAASIDGYVSSHTVGEAATAMARRRFGSFSDACHAAGLKQASHRPRLGCCSVDDCGSAVRSAFAKYCEVHYYRLRRTGTLDVLPAVIPQERHVTSHGYVSLHAPEHPLSNSDKRVYEHRAVYYDTHGDGPFNCHWCSKVVTWGDLHIDHLNDTKDDNRIDNLVASCAECNQARGYHKMVSSWQKKAIHIEFDGRSRTLREWADDLGITVASLRRRLTLWSKEKALTASKGNTGPARRPKKKPKRAELAEKYQNGLDRGRGDRNRGANAS